MKPRIFIGSSVEGKDIADALQVNLNDFARCTVWDQAFPLSLTTIDTLLAKFRVSDFAIFVFSPDDVARIRKQDYAIARDNVIFEAGLFMGMHAKELSFIVVPENAPNFHLLSDLHGLTTAAYEEAWARKEAIPAVGAAATKVREAIKASPWRQLMLDIKSRSGVDTGLIYPLKLRLSLTNYQSSPVLIESLSFQFGETIRPASNARLRSGGTAYQPQFLLGKTSDGGDIYVPRCVIEPAQSVISWVPIDPAHGQPALDEALRTKKTGIWHYRCYWLTGGTTIREYEDAF